MKSIAKIILILCCISGFTIRSSCQVGINTDGSNPDASAILDVKSNSKGFLLPRMTQSQMNAISNPASGLMVFCTDCSQTGSSTLTVFMDGTWNTISANCPLPAAPVAGTNIGYVNQIQWNWNPLAGATGYRWNSLNDYNTSTDMGTGTSYSQTGLTCNTAYNSYVWAYNICGKSVFQTLTQSTTTCPWTCEQPITDGRDGKIYNTVLIGNQCWLAQNLNVGILTLAVDNQVNNGSIEKYCYNDSEGNCNTYGGLYQWSEMMNYMTSSNSNPSGRQGICPQDWHLPSDAEWCQLGTFLDPTIQCGDNGWIGGSGNVGGKMKETGTVDWNSPNAGATNSSGFTGLPGGARYESGGSFDLHTFGYFWSTTDNPSNWAIRWSLYFNFGHVSHDEIQKVKGHSVRCIRD